MKYRTKHVMEYVLLRGVIGLTRRLPYRMALLIGWSIAWLSHYVFRYWVREARERIRSVFGDRYSDSEINRIPWLSWRNFVLTNVDLVHLPRVTLAWIKIHVEGWEQVREIVQRHHATGKGAL